MNSIDKIVDEFVSRCIQNGFHIQKSAEISWVNAILKRLPAKYPASFLSLISRYIFNPFEVGEICLFANCGNNSHDELGSAIFRDEIIFRTTTSKGFIQFSRPADGSYDPVCFDIRKRKKKKECPIVRLDHEDILQFEQIKVVDHIAGSFIEVITR